MAIILFIKKTSVTNNVLTKKKCNSPSSSSCKEYVLYYKQKNNALYNSHQYFTKENVLRKYKKMLLI